MLEYVAQRVNALRYIKLENEETAEEFKILNLRRIKEVYCNDDWYIIINCDQSIESFIISQDLRAKEEFERTLKLVKQKNKLLKK